MSNNTLLIIGGLAALWLLSSKKDEIVVVLPAGQMPSNPLTTTSPINAPAGTVPVGSFAAPGTNSIPLTKNG
jgi:hypothetical protein